MTSEYRDEIIELIFQAYWLKYNKNNPKAPLLNIFGISIRELKEFITSENDVIRQINRMPNEDYLMDVLGQQREGEQIGKSLLGNGDEFNLEDGIDEFFDFVMIDMDELQHSNFNNKNNN